jgi:hypothetical protein
MCLMDVTIRRYNAAREKTDYAVKGNVRLYGGQELVGTIVQGDVAVIVLADALAEADFILPVTPADKVVWGGRERAILAPIGERRALDGTLIAYELQARG